MHLHKTSGDPAGKTAHEKLAKNAQEKGRVSAERPSAQVQSAKLQPVQSKSSAAKSAASPISFLISSAKLPADKLSASIVLFARFFSLPLKPEVLTAIRRQAFTPQNAAESQLELLKQAAENADSSALKNTIEKNRQTFSLAAAAAESKGVELETKGLELYANAIDPDLERRRDSNSHNRQRNKKQNEQNNEGEEFKSGSINGNTLKKIALESAEKNPLLYILNRLPGKDGQRWIVLPFDINENGRDYRVSLRILPESEYTPKRISIMALDIVEIGNFEKRSTFTLEAVNGSVTMLNIYLQPELSPKAKRQLERTFSGFLNIPVERVSVKKSNDSFPLEAGSEDKFSSVDEAV